MSVSGDVCCSPWSLILIKEGFLGEVREIKWQMEEGEVQAEAGVKDCSSFQTLKLTVTRAQRPDRRVGT